MVTTASKVLSRNLTRRGSSALLKLFCVSSKASTSDSESNEEQLLWGRKQDFVGVVSFKGVTASSSSSDDEEDDRVKSEPTLLVAPSAGVSSSELDRRSGGRARVGAPGEPWLLPLSDPGAVSSSGAATSARWGEMTLRRPQVSGSRGQPRLASSGDRSSPSRSSSARGVDAPSSKSSESGTSIPSCGRAGTTPSQKWVPRQLDDARRAVGAPPKQEKRLIAWEGPISLSLGPLLRLRRPVSRNSKRSDSKGRVRGCYLSIFDWQDVRLGGL